MPEWKVNALAGARKPEAAPVEPDASGFQIPMAPPEAAPEPGE
jgi:hypothetical protein